MTNRSRGRRLRASFGMTLVEILIAMAIASLMTLTGWRAVDTLQTSRDRVLSEASQWQRLDDFFVTLEADLRRASISEFSGAENSLALMQPAVDGGPEVQTVRYRLGAPDAASAGSSSSPASSDSRPSASSLPILREAPNGTTPMADVLAMTLAYSVDGTRFESTATAFPRAIRVTALVAGAVGPVERVMALR